jgi:hypothetical protein
MPRLNRTRLRWAIAALIGLATVTAATMGWRSAQIGSDAAFDDRQSISETVLVAQQTVDQTLEVAAEAREYARYRADYGVAAALDHEAERLSAAGALKLAHVTRTQADLLRKGATRRAAAAGVFGSFTIGNDVRKPTAKPRAFNIDARARALAEEQATALNSPGKLKPNRWAQAANEIRSRMKGLSRWALILLISVLLYTIAEVSSRIRWMLAFAGAGLIVYLVGLIGGLSTRFF